MDLNKITKQLGEHYRSWKSEEKEKEKLRKQFFDALTEQAQKKTLARKVIQINADDIVNSSIDEKLTEIKKTHPKWNIIELKEFSQNSFVNHWLVVLEENPEFLKETFINHEDGYVYTRSVEEPILVDTEKLQSEDPDLWKQVSYVPDRQLLALEELSGEQLVKLQKYVYYGKPKVKLLAPREIKPEDIIE